MKPAPFESAVGCVDDLAALAETWIHARRTVLPKRLAAPGPAPSELRRILDAASAAPDHDQLLPWRFVLVPGPLRHRLAGAFEQALVERDPAASAPQREQAREKAHRAPVLLLAVARLAQDGQDVPDVERLLSLGCAVQNMLLMATALGYASALTSGKAMDAAPLRALFGLGEAERAVCFVSIGTAVRTGAGKPRPDLQRFVSELGH